MVKDFIFRRYDPEMSFLAKVILVQKNQFQLTVVSWYKQMRKKLREVNITIRIIQINYLIHPLNSAVPRNMLTPKIQNSKLLMRTMALLYRNLQLWETYWNEKSM